MVCGIRAKITPGGGVKYLIELSCKNTYIGIIIRNRGKMEKIIEEMDNQSCIKRKCYRKLIDETEQTPKTRKKIIESIEERLDKTILTFFTSFKFPVTIDDSDAVIIEEVLQNTEFDRGGFALVLNSAGGSGLAAERIINICPD